MMHLKKTFILSSILCSMLVMWSACGNDNASSQESTIITAPSTTKNTASSPEIAAANISDAAKKSESSTENTEENISKKDTENNPVSEKEEKKEEKKKKKKRAKMHFPEKVYDYGFIMQGDTVIHDFYFKNVGNDDLIITKVKPSCGCTVPIFPREPIAPGKEGKISVMFKSAGKLGRQVPNISVYTNYKRKIKLELKGYVDAERAKPPVIINEKSDSQ